MATTISDQKQFRHEALLYAGRDEFVRGVAPFVAAAVERREPVLVVVDAGKVEALRTSLGAKASSVEFADMAAVGRNPGRILPAWQDFVDRHAGKGPLRGVGEPATPGRSAAELSECQRHEALLNVAFEHRAPWWLLCPYDEATLAPDVIAGARTTHPFLLEQGRHRRSATALTTAAHALPCTELLSPRPSDASVLDIADTSELALAREFASATATQRSFRSDRLADLQLVVTELVTNSLRHAGTGANLAIWIDEPTGALVCDVRDDGAIPDPLAGRRRPIDEDPGGRGLWIVQHVADLLQQRRLPEGNVARAHFAR